MSLVEKTTEIYNQIKELDKTISKTLVDYKDFETFNKFYLEKQELWKKYYFFQGLAKARGEMKCSIKS